MTNKFNVGDIIHDYKTKLNYRVTNVNFGVAVYTLTSISDRAVVRLSFRIAHSYFVRLHSQLDSTITDAQLPNQAIAASTVYNSVELLNEPHSNPACECGAKHTTSPNLHSDWCPVFAPNGGLA